MTRRADAAMKLFAGLVQATATHIPLRDESVQCIVTSPPYWGLRSYAGEQRQVWDDGWYGALGLEPEPAMFVEHIVAIFRECWRVLRKDGTLWLNLGDSYAGSGKGLYGDGLSHGTEGAKQRTNAGSIGSPYVGQSGSIPAGSGLKPKDLIGIPWRVALALQADGWWLRSDIVWSKPNPMPESVTDRPTRSHEYVFLLAKRSQYFYDAVAIKEEAINEGLLVKASGAAAKNAMADAINDRRTAAGFTTHDTRIDGRNARSVWQIATQPYPGAHFATFPEKLAERCILAGSSLESVVLDPFAGTGTTGRVAVRHGRAFVGLDISREYLSEQAAKRIDKVQQAMPL